MLRSSFVLVTVAVLAVGCSPRAPVLPAPGTGPGTPVAGPRWTVELHSGPDGGRAEEIASQAQLRFEETVSVVEIGGEHHVRVGDLRTEAEARQLAEIARERGYRSARAVPAPTTQP